MLTNFQIQFSRRLKNRRIKLNLTIQQAVDAFNEISPVATSVRSWSAWECETLPGHREPKLAVWPHLAAVLELSGPRLLLPERGDSHQEPKFNHIQRAGLSSGRELRLRQLARRKKGTAKQSR